jgi:hypothetical protein
LVDGFCLQLPCIMWLCIYKPKPFSLSWITNWVSFSCIPTHTPLSMIVFLVAKTCDLKNWINLKFNKKFLTWNHNIFTCDPKWNECTNLFLTCNQNIFTCNLSKKIAILLLTWNHNIFICDHKFSQFSVFPQTFCLLQRSDQRSKI